MQEVVVTCDHIFVTGYDLAAVSVISSRKDGDKVLGVMV